MSFGERYLRHPDLFPSRMSGEAWGDGVLRIEIAGVSLTLAGLSPLQLELASRRYRDLLLPFPTSPDDVRLDLYRAPAEDFLPFDTAGWQLSFDFDATPDALSWAGRSTMARLVLAPSGDGAIAHRAALWTPAASVEEFPGVLENVLRVLVARRLLERGGALLHSAGVRLDDRAYLFVGRSGAGKSTLCGLSQSIGLTILSDELNALAFEDGELRLRQLPFAGDFGEVAIDRRSFPLAGIYFLRQGPAAALAPITPGRALAHLVAASPFVNADAALADDLLVNLERIVRAAPLRELTFRLDPDFWGILKTSA